MTTTLSKGKVKETIRQLEGVLELNLPKDRRSDFEKQKVKWQRILEKLR